MDLWTAMKRRTLSDLFHRPQKLIRSLTIPLSLQALCNIVAVICALLRGEILNQVFLCRLPALLFFKAKDEVSVV